jgi:hypothetical protein
MPTDTTSPFTPGRPVPVEFFVGRAREIERLLRKVRDCAAVPRVEIAFVSGERGIGKSSLASFVRYVAEKEHAAIGVHALLGGIASIEGTVKRVFDQMLKDHSDGKLLESLKGLFGKHVRKVGLFGITLEFDAPERELRGLADGFSSALRNLLDKLPDRESVILILDDINGLAGSQDFANWFKSLVDEISTSRKPIPLCVFFVGLDERRRSLIASQPSLARVFDPVDIPAWSDDESRSFFESTFKKAGMECSAESLDTMTRYAGGLPVLAHEIGDAAFAADRDGAVDHSDAAQGVLAAADVVGRRYLDPMVYSSLRSPRYRAILRRMARELSYERFTRAQIRESLPSEERRVFDNFLGKMKKLGVVVEDPEKGRGSYRFSTLLHYLYFSMEASRAHKVA